MSVAQKGTSRFASPRFDWVDNAKAVLIYLVVLGHSTSMVGKSVIYAFHVPAFLFISGFLLPVYFGRLAISEIFSRWILVYFKAYLLFSTFSILLWWLATSLSTQRLINILPAIQGMIYGVGGEDGGLIHENGPLWYFPFIVSSFVGAWVCLRLPTMIGTSLAVGWAVFAIYYDGPRLPWCLDIAGIGVIVTIAGYHARQNWRLSDSILGERRKNFTAAVVLGALLIVGSELNGATNLNRDMFGQSGILFIITMFIGIAMIVSISSFVQAKPLCRALSKETLTIFAIHIYFVHRANEILPHIYNTGFRLLTVLVSSAIILLVSLGIAILIRPILDMIVFNGRKRKQL